MTVGGKRLSPRVTSVCVRVPVSPVRTPVCKKSGFPAAPWVCVRGAADEVWPVPGQHGSSDCRVLAGFLFSSQVRAFHRALPCHGVAWQAAFRAEGRRSAKVAPPRTMPLSLLPELPCHVTILCVSLGPESPFFSSCKGHF